jgi:hypothetical protein
MFLGCSLLVSGFPTSSFPAPAPGRWCLHRAPWRPPAERYNLQTPERLSRLRQPSGMRQCWYRNQCVAAGWPPKWAKGQAWTRAENALEAMQPDDAVVVALRRNREASDAGQAFSSLGPVQLYEIPRLERGEGRGAQASSTVRSRCWRSANPELRGAAWNARTSHLLRAMSTKPLIARLDELLKPLGFARHQTTWNRKSDTFVDVIDVQTSKAGDTITINTGVFHPDIHRKCWATEPAAVIDEPSCTVRARVGQLLDGKDLWWRLEDARTLNEVIEKLNAHVLPFLERMHSLDAMEQFLTASDVTRQKYPLPAIYLAILQSERGDRTGACALLAELGKKAVGAWRTRISEVAWRLGCSSGT